MRAEDLIGLGDHPALDLLNSTGTPQRETLELLETGEGYLRWLELTGVLAVEQTHDIGRRFSNADLGRVAGDARELREWLRGLIGPWAAGEQLDRTQVEHLNALLRDDPRHRRLDAHNHGSLRLVTRWDWTTPSSLLVPAAEAVAELLSEGDSTLVRNCDGPGCSMWFYDRTRTHQRRWCSMAICGNRAKARAHRERARPTTR